MKADERHVEEKEKLEKLRKNLMCHVSPNKHTSGWFQQHSSMDGKQLMAARHCPTTWIFLRGGGRRASLQQIQEISLSIKFVFLFTVFLRKHLSLSPSSLEKSISIKYILYFVVLTLQINYKSIHHLYLCFSLPYNNREIKLHSALQWANYTMSIKTSGSNLTNSIDNHSHS